MTQNTKQTVKLIAVILLILTVVVGNITLFYMLGWIQFSFYALGLAILTSRDFKMTKSPFDKKKEPFDFYDDWLIWRYDDMIFWNIGGMAGAGLSSELFMPIIINYTDWNALAEMSLDNTGILISTMLGASVLNRIINGKIKR